VFRLPAYRSPRLFPPAASTTFALAAAVVLAGASGSAAPQQPRREFSVSAHKYGYRVSGTDQPVIRVTQGDQVHIEFSAEDIPHSFITASESPYRIMKRAEPGKSVAIDFLADQPGSFTFYCNLPIDERCAKDTRGQIVVERKK
jgi:heme/copper-type cytochrome/quinol oxidase subunit 2